MRTTTSKRGRYGKKDDNDDNSDDDSRGLLDGRELMPSSSSFMLPDTQTFFDKLRAQNPEFDDNVEDDDDDDDEGVDKGR